MLNLACPHLGAEQVPKLVAAGVPARCQKLLGHPVLGEEARGVLLNFSASAPEAFLAIQQQQQQQLQGGGGGGGGKKKGGAGRGASSSGTSGGGSAAAAAAAAVVAEQACKLDVASSDFNVQDAVFAINTLRNFVMGGSPHIYWRGEVLTVARPSSPARCCCSLLRPAADPSAACRLVWVGTSCIACMLACVCVCGLASLPFYHQFI